MVILFVAVQSFLGSKYDRTFGTRIGEHVWEMFAFNVLHDVPFYLGLCSIAESTTECSIHVVHKILIKILMTCDLTS